MFDGELSRCWPTHLAGGGSGDLEGVRAAADALVHDADSAHAHESTHPGGGSRLAHSRTHTEGDRGGGLPCLIFPKRSRCHAAAANESLGAYISSAGFPPTVDLLRTS